MQKYLPHGDFKWVDENVTKNFDCTIVDDDSSKGYILEVDVEYPDKLHDLHKDLPFFPVHEKPPGSKNEKLLTTLHNKEKYIVHYQYLKQALKHGLIVKKIHRVLEFDQSPYIKKYIDINTKFRREAKNKFEEDFFKLMINSVFGKSLENVRNRVDVKLITKWYGRYGAEAYISKPNFHSCTIFGENLVAIEMSKLEVIINKPIYIGLSILDISKVALYDFHYNFMKQKLGNLCKLLYTDTDSLIYDIKHDNIYKFMLENIEKFDTSNYPENDVRLPRKNKKIAGLMKDECNGEIITEFIGLKSKMYSIKIEGGGLIKKAKGVKTSIVKNEITFNDYKLCLLESQVLYKEQYRIGSKFHKLYTIKCNKLALSPSDDKRCLLTNSTDTLPWGHKDLR